MSGYRIRFKYLHFRNIGILLLILIIMTGSLVFANYKRASKPLSTLPLYYTNSIKQPHFLTYVKNNCLYFINEKNQKIELSNNAFLNPGQGSENASHMQESYIFRLNVLQFNDQGILYFLADYNVQGNYGTLYRYEEGKGVSKIAYPVSMLQISSDSNHIIFSTYEGTDSMGNNLGSLYMIDLKNNSLKITDNYPSDGTVISGHNNDFMFFTEFNKKSLENDLYIRYSNGAKVLIDSGGEIYPVQVSDDGKTIAYYILDKGGESKSLYVKQYDKTPKLIGSNVEDFIIFPTDFSCYFLNGDDTSHPWTLYYKELNKPKIKIASNVNTFDYIPNNYLKMLKNKEIIYSQSSSNGLQYYLLDNKKPPVKLFNASVTAEITSDPTLTDFLYFSQRDNKQSLMKSTFLSDKKTFINKIIDDNITPITVNTFLTGGDLSKFFYTKQSDSSTNLYCYDSKTNKTSLLLNNVGIIDQTSYYNNELSFISENTETGNNILYTKKDGEACEEISENVVGYYSFNDRTIYYLKSCQKDSSIYSLYMKNVGQPEVLIDTLIDSSNIPMYVTH